MGKIMLIVSAATLTALAACSSSGGHTVPAGTSASSASTAAASSSTDATGTHTTASQSTGTIGTTITLHGATAASAIQVTLLAVDRTAHYTDNGVSTVDKGYKLFTAKLRLRNVGSATSTLNPAQNSLVITTDRARTIADYLGSTVSSGPVFPQPLRIAAGGGATGWVAYIVPTSATVRSLQLALNASSSSIAQWTV